MDRIKVSGHSKQTGGTAYKATLICLIILASLPVLAQNCYSTESATGRIYIFSLQDPDPQSFTVPEMNDDFVDGISWRFRWKTIEPQEGMYEWHMIDRAVESTAKAGKKVMLRVIAGQHTPEWVYDEGAEKFSFTPDDLYHSGNYMKESMTMPVPWDSVYLQRWGKFIREFGKRYDRRLEIYSIQMSGGGRIGEMNLPKNVDGWMKAGYTNEKMINVWKQIIDVYQQSFPTRPTNLDINRPLRKSSDEVLYDLVEHVLNAYGGKVYLQQNGLKSDLPYDYPIRSILRRASKKTKVGYQMAGGKGWLDGVVGDRGRAFHIAEEDSASYIEVYSGDTRDAETREVLKAWQRPVRPAENRDPSNKVKER